MLPGTSALNLISTSEPMYKVHGLAKAMCWGPGVLDSWVISWRFSASLCAQKSRAATGMTRRIVHGIGGNVRAEEMDPVWNSGLVGVPRFHFDFICIGHRHPLFSILSIAPTGTCEGGGVSSRHGW